jgi:hypothetical protein
VRLRSLLSCSHAQRCYSELFHYKEEDIYLMTDEEANSNTALWPSGANIVSLGLHIRPYALPWPLPALTDNPNGFRYMCDLVRDASRADAFIFFRGPLLLLALILSDSLFLSFWTLRSAASHHGPRQDRRPQRMGNLTSYLGCRYCDMRL